VRSNTPSNSEPKRALSSPRLRLVVSNSHPEMDAVETQVRQPKKRSWWRMPLALVGIAALLSALAATGWLVYHDAKKKKLNASLRGVDRMLRRDTELGYHEGDRNLAALSRKAGSVAVLGRRAEVNSILWGRFGAGKQAEHLARRLLKSMAKDTKRKQVITAYLDLYGGHPDRAADRAERALLHHPRSAKLAYILAMARLRSGDLDAAEATLRLAASYDRKFIPARYHLAVVERLRRRFEQCRRSLEQVLALSPEHQGAHVEMAVLDAQAKGTLTSLDLDGLEKSAGRSLEYQARVLYLRGEKARRRGEYAEARRWFRRAAVRRPDEPEYALALVDAFLAPGGDVSAAQRLRLPPWKQMRQYPAAALVMARLALAGGGSRRALSRLDEIRWSALDSLSLARALALRVQALDEAWRFSDAALVCGKAMTGGASGTKEAVKVPVLLADACVRHGLLVGDQTLVHRLRLLVADPERKRLYRGIERLVAHRPEDARSDLKMVSREHFPSFLDVKVRALSELGRPRAALALARSLSDTAGGAARSRLVLVRAEMAAGQRRKASKEARGILHALKPEAVGVLFELGRLLLELGEPSRAYRLARRLRKRSDGRGLGAFLQGLYWTSKRRYNKAAHWLEKALSQAPDLWQAKDELARVRFLQGRKLVALRLAREAYRRSGKDPDVLAGLVRLYLAGPDVRSVGRLLARTARAYRHDGATWRASELYGRYADVLSRQKAVNRRKVARLFKRALRHRSASPKAYFLYGEYLRRRGKLDRAVRFYRKAVRACPEDTDALYRLGWGLVHLKKRRVEAMETIEMLRRLEPGRARSIRAARWLRRLHHG